MTTFDVIGYAAYFVVLVGILAAAGWGLASAYRKRDLTDPLIEAVCARLQLTVQRLDVNDGPRAGFLAIRFPRLPRGSLLPFRYSIGKGMRGGMAVEVEIAARRDASRTATHATTVALAAPRPLPLDVVAVSCEGLPVPSERIYAFLRWWFPIYEQGLSRMKERIADVPGLGRSVVCWKSEDLDRLLTPEVQALLAGFPRRLHTVGVHGGAIYLGWWWGPQEEEPAVIEQALALCARLLALW